MTAVLKVDASRPSWEALTSLRASAFGLELEAPDYGVRTWHCRNRPSEIHT
jgi:hypothetical protein